ncbi:MAG: TatD family hydrolase [Intrasporangium sp.]|uniref:TatD family hydrolase n=1 Tax=Intrasporangium sp. TaxID=1925024 RepID=UPI002648D252|nr:TatD family hydrolase [Intrasporangium sp.]MDN5797779.1 TatD family hydrolase [Intrasporangium sp.]
MTANWPPLDMHAHVDPAIRPDDLLALRAVIFAASRTLEESGTALDRQNQDPLAVWGVGVHPGVKAALETYDPARFTDLIARTAYVGEVGLDGRVQSRLQNQTDVLISVLAILQQQPRITSLHSYNTTRQLIEALEQTPIQGAVLHWWLGDRSLTERAVALGAHFSVNAANLKNTTALDLIPLDRLLTETDHPDGNRWSTQPRQPGNVTKVEKALGDRHGLTGAAFRAKCWKNLQALASTTGTTTLLPERVQRVLAEA